MSLLGQSIAELRPAVAVKTLLEESEEEASPIPPVPVGVSPLPSADASSAQPDPAARYTR